MKDAKAKRLVEVANLYYIEEKNQNEIADELGISRPMVSRLLSDAKEHGVINITINNPRNLNIGLCNKVKALYGLTDIIPVSCNRNLYDEALEEISKEAVQYYLSKLSKLKNVGIGWGASVGAFIDRLAYSSTHTRNVHNVCPLIGNSGINDRNYHTDELVRVFSDKHASNALYLHTPVYMETEAQAYAVQTFESYRQADKLWKNLDIAIFSVVGPETLPDFANSFKANNPIIGEKAVGKAISHFFDIEGNYLKTNLQSIIQIPYANLKAVPVRFAIASPNTSVNSLKAVLKSGMITHLVVPDDIISKLF